MNYWITTHWPPREDDPDDIANGLWVPDDRKIAGEDVRKGDLVVVYQAKTGRTEVRTAPDGRKKFVKTIQGKEGIIAIAEAQGAMYV